MYWWATVMDHGILLLALPLMEFILQIKLDPLLEYIDIMLLSISKERSSRRFMRPFLVYAQYCIIFSCCGIHRWSGGWILSSVKSLSNWWINKCLNFVVNTWNWELRIYVCTLEFFRYHVQKHLYGMQAPIEGKRALPI